MGDKPIADKLPSNCDGATIAVVLEEGTCELHRRVLLTDLEEDSGYCESFVREMKLDVVKKDVWECIKKKVETMTISEIRTFAGY